MAVMESISLINSIVRTVLAVVIVGGVGYAGWFGYSTVREHDRETARTRAALDETRGELEATQAQLAEKDETIKTQTATIEEQAGEITDLEEDVREKERKIQRLDTAMKLLKVDHRVARLTVVDQGTDPGTGELFSLVEFAELNRRGDPIEQPRRFRVSGDVVYIDYWIAKFEEQYVEEADLLRSTSLVLFRRMFGEFQKPTDGTAIDEAGRRPAAYGDGTVPSDFEEKIWSDFWNIANDPTLAASLGIRAAHGEAVSMKVGKGRRYRLLLRASDGLSIVPEDAPPGGF